MSRSHLNNVLSIIFCFVLVKIWACLQPVKNHPANGELIKWQCQQTTCTNKMISVKISMSNLYDLPNRCCVRSGWLFAPPRPNSSRFNREIFTPVVEISRTNKTFITCVCLQKTTFANTILL